MGAFKWEDIALGSVEATMRGLPWLADLNDIEDPKDFEEDYPNFAEDWPYGKYVAKWIDNSFLLSDIGYAGGTNSGKRFMIANGSRKVKGIPWGNYTTYDVPYGGKFTWQSTNGIKEVPVYGFTVRRNMPVPIRINPDNSLRTWHNWGTLPYIKARYFVTRKGSGTEVYRLDTDEHSVCFKYDAPNDTVRRYFNTKALSDDYWVQDNWSSGPTMIIDIQAGGGGGAGSGGDDSDSIFQGNGYEHSNGGGGGGAGGFLSIIIDLSKIDHLEIKTTAGSQFGRHGGNKEGEHDGESGECGVNVYLNLYEDATETLYEFVVFGGSGGKSVASDNVLEYILDADENEKKFRWETSIGGGNGGYYKLTKPDSWEIPNNSVFAILGGTSKTSPAASGGNAGCCNASNQDKDDPRRTAEAGGKTTVAICEGNEWLRTQTLSPPSSWKGPAFGYNTGHKTSGGGGGVSCMGHPGQRDYDTEYASTDTKSQNYFLEDCKPYGYGYGGCGGARNGFANTGTNQIDEGQDGGQACIIVYY